MPPQSSLLREMWPVLSMMRLLGWLPAHRRHDSDTLHVRPANLVYSCAALAVQILPPSYIAVKCVMLMSRMDPELLLVSYIQVVCGVVVPQLYPIFAVYHVSQHVAFWNELRAFQVAVERLSLSGCPLVFGLRGLSLAVLVNYCLPGVAILVVRPLVLGVRPTWTLDLIFSLNAGVRILLLGWWVIAMKAVRVSSQRLLEEFRLLREYNEAGRQLDQLAMSTRPLWLQLCRLVRGSGDALAFAQMLLLLDCFTIVLYFSYNLMNRQTAGTTVFLLVVTVVGFSIISTLCIAAHNAQEKVRRDLQVAISITKHLNTSLHIKELLLKFFTHLSQRSPEVSLSGYMTVGRGLISTLVATLLSNMVVLYQLKITERRINVNDFFNFGVKNDI